jgi:hypothetical protein
MYFAERSVGVDSGSKPTGLLAYSSCPFKNRQLPFQDELGEEIGYWQ